MIDEPQTAPVSPAGILRGYLQLLRLPNIFMAMADVMMGFLLTHRLSPLGAGLGASALLTGLAHRYGIVLGLLLVSSAALYAAGVILNDVFDYDDDLRERPERPLPSGRVALRRAQRLGWQCLMSGLTFGWLATVVTHNYRSGLVATLLAVLIVLYDTALRRTPLGPLAMGGCRMLNVLLGMSVLGGPGQPDHWQPHHWLVAGAVGLYIVGLTWFSRQEADRSRRAALGLATAVMLAGVALLSLLPLATDDVIPLLSLEPSRWVILMLMLGAIILVRCIWAVSEPTPGRVQMAVKQGLLSLVVLDAAAALAVEGLPGAILVLAFLLPAVFLGTWISST
jgi:4-hydroxybenzoate polyprenyltransferase